MSNLFSLQARLEAMVREGWLSIVPGHGERRYRLTTAGKVAAAGLPPKNCFEDIRNADDEGVGLYINSLK